MNAFSNELTKVTENHTIRTADANLWFDDFGH